MIKSSLRGRKIYKERVQIPVKELRIGMYVSELEIAWDQSPFLVKGFKIKSEKSIRKLRSVCRYVYIDVTKSRLERVKPQPVKSPLYCDTIEVAVKKCKPIYDQSVALMTSVFESQHLDKESIEQAKSLVNDYVDNAFENPSVLRWLSLSDAHYSHLIEHSLKVTILSLMLGIAAGLGKDELKDLGLAALMHDLGMLNVPDSILKKKGELSIDETCLIQKHSLFSVELLRADSALSKNVIAAILNHHERLDGQGYPSGLKSYDIPLLSKIIAIADTFDGQTSHRSYHSASSSLDALKTLMALRDTHFDEALVIKFIRVIGVYPVGSIVEIDDDRVGIVLPTVQGDKMRPDVLVVRNAEKEVITPYKFKLSEADGLKIAKVLPDGARGVFFQDYADSIL